MLLDDVQGLRALEANFRAFTDSSESRRVFSADVDGSPEPYARFLSGIRVHKVQDAPPRAVVSPDDWLELHATVADLHAVCAKLSRVNDGEHVHFHASPTSLIIEADGRWGDRDG